MFRVEQATLVDGKTTEYRYDIHMTSGTVYQAITQVKYKQLHAASLGRKPQ